MTGKRKSDKGAAKAAPVRSFSVLRLRGAGCFIGDTEEEMRLARFCADVADGVDPDPDYLRLVAKALEHFLGNDEKTATKGDRVGKALGIARKQGKARSALLKQREQAYAVVDYLQNQETMPEAEAAKAAADKHGIGMRAMRDRIAKLGEVARELIEIDDQFKKLAAAISKRIGSEKET